jgi:uncharacterized protein YecT (DUF1311 family)
MTASSHFARVFVAASALLVGIASAALAEQIPTLCAKERNQAEMNRCASDHLKKADAEMAKTLQDLLAATEDENRKYVTEAQDARQAYRDKECTSRIGGSPNRGGTIWPMMNLLCRTGLARARIKDLKEQVKCPGGRMDC